MQTFINPTISVGQLGHCWQFEDDVIVEILPGAVDDDGYDLPERRHFYTAQGVKLDVPDTLVPGEIPSPTLDDLKTAKINELSGKCKQQIVSGFESTALGSSYHYPTKETDQLNLASSVIDSLLPNLPADWTTPFWCEDAVGVWSFKPHTAEQIQQVGRDAKAAVLACMAKNAGLAQQVLDAKTQEDVEKIKWEAPVHAEL